MAWHGMARYGLACVFLCIYIYKINILHIIEMCAHEVPVFVCADYLADISSGLILLDPKQGGQLLRLPPRWEDGIPNCEIFSFSAFSVQRGWFADWGTGDSSDSSEVLALFVIS